jgi:hypothetical protein
MFGVFAKTPVFGSTKASATLHAFDATGSQRFTIRIV